MAFCVKAIVARCIAVREAICTLVGGPVGMLLFSFRREGSFVDSNYIGH